MMELQKRVLKETCDVTGFRRIDLLKSRRPQCIEARFVAINVMRRCLKMTLSGIAGTMRYQNHSGVMYAINRHEHSMGAQSYKTLYERVEFAALYAGRIATYTGRLPRPFDLDPADVCIEDIFHNLARIPRWNGSAHSEYQMSVAEHCTITYKIVRGWNAPWQTQLLALVHDWPEYLIGDTMSPIKGSVFVVHNGEITPIGRVENDILRKILMALGHGDLWPFSREDWRIVARADEISCFSEARDIMHGTDGWSRTTKEDLLGFTIEPAPPGVAEKMLAEAYVELTQ